MKSIFTYIRIVIITFLGFFFYSCSEKITLELDSTSNRCVIFGQITTDTTAHVVTIHSSGDYFNNAPPRGISGAIVRISDGVEEYILQEVDTIPGRYITDNHVFGVPGRTYTLYVEDVDLNEDGALTSYQASSELLPVAEPDSINVFFRNEWKGWVVQAFAQDPPESKDYYKFLVWVNGVLNSDSLLNINVTDDTFFNGSYTNGVVIYYVFGESYNPFKVNDTITAGFCGITEDYYKFIIEAQVAARPSAPLFSGPPANPRTNFNNGALGYFTAFSISRATTVIKENSQ